MAYKDPRERDRQEVDDRRTTGNHPTDHEPAAEKTKDDTQGFRFTDWASI